MPGAFGENLGWIDYPQIATSSSFFGIAAFSQNIKAVISPIGQKLDWFKNKSLARKL